MIISVQEKDLAVNRTPVNWQRLHYLRGCNDPKTWLKINDQEFDDGRINSF